MDVVRESRSVLYSIKEIMLKLLDLFSGIGGFSLGLESTGGFETIAFVEKDDFCQKVLKKHWPNTTIEGDIRNVKGDKYEADIITGGFPCQPFSVAGKRKGTDDDRYLWDETIRVVRECKPRWFIGENVEGLININNGVVLRQVQTDLEKEGFEVQCLVIPASGVGAWHQRKRVWIMAYSNSNGHRNKIGRSNGEKEEIQNQHRQNDSTSRKSSGTSSIWETSIEYVPNTSSQRQFIRNNREMETKTRDKKGTRDQSSFQTLSSCSDVSNTESIGHRGWSSQECKNGEWSFLQGEQKGRKMGSEIEGCYGDVSNSESKRTRKNDQGLWESFGGINGREGTNVSNSNDERLQGLNSKSILQEQKLGLSANKDDEGRETWWQTQSRICGVPNGVSFELDKGRNNRIKSLGNSIVPQIVRQLGFAILEAEKNT